MEYLLNYQEGRYVIYLKFVTNSQLSTRLYGGFVHYLLFNSLFSPIGKSEDNICVTKAQYVKKGPVPQVAFIMLLTPITGHMSHMVTSHEQRQMK